MAKQLEPWCKDVKKAMIDRDIGVYELAAGVDMAREHVSAIINGRVHSAPGRKKISNYLNIPYTEA